MHSITPAAIAERLGRVPGIVAVVLGGSHARGANSPDSDLDLGIYYRADARPAIKALRAAAADLAGEDQARQVTDYGAWGPWVNGGAWLVMNGRKVDWIYRELDAVDRVIADCHAGRVSCDYYLGHPHGFHNHVYMAEVYWCRPLHDPAGEIARLKQATVPYPAALRRALVERYLGDASFMHELARNPARRGDVFHVCGCLFRCAAALVQVLFALNARYFMNEKGALREMQGFAQQPAACATRLADMLAAPGATSAALVQNWERMGRLIAETRALAEHSASA